jgi:transcriptional regulator
MYLPKLYREEDKERILDFLKRNNFAAVVSFDGERPIATHLPTEVQEDEHGELVIYSHMSRANPQWKTIEGKEVFIFQGPLCYFGSLVQPAMCQPGTTP